MRLGVGGDSDREVADLAHQLDELDCVLQLPRRQVEVGGRVAAEAEDVLDPGIAVPGDDLDELRPCVRGTREVRHGRHRRGAEDVDHDLVGALARGAAGAVGDRDVRGGQGLELDERGAERLLHLGRARWEELEREAQAPLQDVTDLGHWRQSVGG